nr:Bm1581 [Brugia malayi]
MIKLQQQQTKLDQQKGISEQFPQRQQRIQQIQKPKANENGS